MLSYIKMLCDKCNEPIFSKREKNKVEEKVEVKQKTKRAPSLYNTFLSDYLKRSELKDVLPKERMKIASQAWKDSKC